MSGAIHHFSTFLPIWFDLFAQISTHASKRLRYHGLASCYSWMSWPFLVSLRTACEKKHASARNRWPNFFCTLSIWQRSLNRPPVRRENHIFLFWLSCDDKLHSYHPAVRCRQAWNSDLTKIDKNWARVILGILAFRAECSRASHVPHITACVHIIINVWRCWPQLT